MATDPLTSPATATRESSQSVSRRDVLKATAVTSGLGMLPMPAVGASSTQPETAPKLKLPGPTARVVARINGRPVDVQVDTRTSLLDLLREDLKLTGAKKGCDHGQCGACTVHVDGRRVTSCLTLAAKVDGAEVLTIEGVGTKDRLHPMQQAFIDHDALQCGYCTPGQVMAAIACVKEGNAHSADSIREFMSGNLCRCGAYVGIVAAIQDAARKMGAT